MKRYNRSSKNLSMSLDENEKFPRNTGLKGEMEEVIDHRGKARFSSLFTLHWKVEKFSLF